MMKLLVFMVCLLVTTLAAPISESDSNEEKQVAAHANEALRWMEMYRLYQQQGVGNPFLPAADAPPTAAAVGDAAPAQSADVPLPAAQAVEDASEEETEGGNPAPKDAAPGAPAVPLNSDEVEEAEEAEEVEAAEAEPAVVEEAPADPAAAVEPAVVDVPVDAAPAEATAVDVPPVDVVPLDVAPAAPAAPEVAVVAAASVTADVPAAVDAGVADAGAAPPAAEVETTVSADPAAV